MAMENAGVATLSNKGEWTTFSYGGYDFRFRTSKKMVKYVQIKEWDAACGYIVVDCLHEKLGVVEDYIDLLPMFEHLYFDAEKFLRPIKRVEIKYDDLEEWEKE